MDAKHAARIGDVARELAESMNRLMSREHRRVDVGGTQYIVTVARCQTLADLERARILEALNSHNWHRERTADELGISRRTLQNKIRQYGIGRMSK